MFVRFLGSGNIGAGWENNLLYIFLPYDREILKKIRKLFSMALLLEIIYGTNCGI